MTSPGGPDFQVDFLYSFFKNLGIAHKNSTIAEPSIKGLRRDHAGSNRRRRHAFLEGMSSNMQDGTQVQ